MEPVRNLSLHKTRRKRVNWTDERRKVAHAMRREGATLEEISSIIGMNISAISREVAGEKPLKAEPEGIGRVHFESVRAARPSAATIAEFEQRHIARLERDETDLARGVCTAAFFGDPPPGYSALDRKRAGA